MSIEYFPKLQNVDVLHIKKYLASSHCQLKKEKRVNENEKYLSSIVFFRQLFVNFNSMHKPPALYNGNVLQI